MLKKAHQLQAVSTVVRATSVLCRMAPLRLGDLGPPSRPPFGADCHLIMANCTVTSPTSSILDGRRADAILFFQPSDPDFGSSEAHHGITFSGNH